MARPVCLLTLNAGQIMRKDFYVVTERVAYFSRLGENVEIGFTGGGSLLIGAADEDDSLYLVDGLARAVSGAEAIDFLVREKAAP